MNAVLVGRVNVRQLRVTSCDRRHDLSCCHSLYSEASRDSATFGPHTSFHYHTAEDTGAAVYNGRFGLYGGDGYLWSFPAGYERYDLSALLKSIRCIFQLKFVGYFTLIYQLTLDFS